MDTHLTSVICLEDGIPVPNSKKVLPYGRWDVFNLIKGLLRKQDCWPWPSSSPSPAGTRGGGEGGRKYRGIGCNAVEEFRALEDIYLKCCR